MNTSFSRGKRIKSSIRESIDSIKRSNSTEKLTRDSSMVSKAIRIYGRLDIKKKLKSLKDLNIEVKPESYSRKSNIFVINRQDSLTTLNKTKPKVNKGAIIEHEIVKAKSDLFDLKRDIATYDFNFMNQYQKTELGKDLQPFYFTLSSTCESLSQCLKENQILAQSINEVLIPIAKSEEKVSGTQFLSDIQKKHKILVTRAFYFQGIIVISGVRCTIVVKTSADTHKIECLLPNDKSLTLFVYKHFPSFKDDADYVRHIKYNLLPFIFIDTSTTEVFLHFSENYGKEFLTFYIFLKGSGLELVKIHESGENFVIEAKGSLLVSKSLFDVEEISLEKAEKIKNKIKSECYFYNYSLFWDSNPFKNRESTSDILNGKLLERLLDASFRKIFASNYRYKGKNYKLDIFETGKEKFVEISSSKFSFTVQENTPENQMLTSLQMLNLSTSPVTLLKSLEFSLLTGLVFAHK